MASELLYGPRVYARSKNRALLTQLLVCLTFFLPCALRAEPPSRAVFDIDGVVAYGVNESVVEKFPPATFPSIWSYGNCFHYFIAPGTAEALFAIQEVLGMELSFFSRGVEERNKILLGEIPILPGVNALQFAGERLFSRQHLVDSRDFFTVFVPKSIFAGREKKNLSVLGDNDLGNTVLVDDHFKYSQKGEEKNLLKVFGGTNFTNLADEIEQGAPIDQVAQREMGKLVRVVGLLALAQEKAKREGVTLTDALEEIQWDGDHYRVGETHSEVVYQRGNQVFSSPSFVTAAREKGLRFNYGSCSLFLKLLDRHLEK